ncbi:hypothetical protein SMICM17S_12065 [Streptomyces microflavus]
MVGAGWLYLVPQLQGAGLTLKILTGAPGWLGDVLVATVVTVAVAAGGMRSITFVQVFQYWLKLTALLVPALFLVLAWQGDGRPRVSFDDQFAVFRADHPLTGEWDSSSGPVCLSGLFPGVPEYWGAALFPGLLR